MSQSPHAALLAPLLAERILLLDGAMGTMIQAERLGEAEFRGERFRDWPKELRGNNDLLVLTQPQIVRRIHTGYLEAGADVISTNTFNATSVSLADYGMQTLAYDLNLAAAQLAKKTALEWEDKMPSRPRFVAECAQHASETAVRGFIPCVLIVAAFGAVVALQGLEIFQIFGTEAMLPSLVVVAILREAGVRRALVSSTPDDGTVKLYEKAPAGIVPFLRPYRTREDMGSWPRDPAVAAYVEERLKRGIYRGIGESHFGADDVTAPTLRRLAELATEQKLFLHCHVDEATVEKLLTTYPGVRVLWAHAGMSSSAAAVGRPVSRKSNSRARASARCSTGRGARRVTTCRWSAA